MGAGRRACRTRPPSRRFPGPQRWPSYDAAVSISGELQRARQLALAAKEEAAKELLLSLGPEIERQDRDDLALEVFAQLGEIYLNRTAYDGTAECLRRIDECVGRYSQLPARSTEVEHMIAHYTLRSRFLRVGLAAAHGDHEEAARELTALQDDECAQRFPDLRGRPRAPLDVGGHPVRDGSVRRRPTRPGGNVVAQHHSGHRRFDRQLGRGRPTAGRRRYRIRPVLRRDRPAGRRRAVAASRGCAGTAPRLGIVLRASRTGDRRGQLATR